jgi:methyl-accepting chemotaxis protein
MIYSTMKRHGRSTFAILVLGVATLASTTATSKEKPGDAPPTPPAATPAATKSEELQGQVKDTVGWANEFAKEIAQTMEGWVTSNATSLDRLFSHLYYPLPDTDPTKYTTDYDSLADRDFQAINEKYLAKSGLNVYAIPMDINGYAPTHNRQFSQPLTGNRAVDLINNRTKRIFGDLIGFRAARSAKPYLVQTYARDTGEAVIDISVPVMVRGRHWGCVRIGFRQVENQ